MATIDPIRLHPEAAKNFDKRAEGLLGLVSPVPMQDRRVRIFSPDIKPHAQFTEKDFVGEVQLGFVDYRGTETGRVFEHGGRTIGLVGKSFKQLQELAARLQETPGIRPYVSFRCLVDCGFQWLRSRYRGESGESFTDFVLRESSARVKEIEIWYPLYHVYIQSEFPLGKIVFRTLNREMFDRYCDRLPKDLPAEERAAFQASFERRRSKLQACAAATMRVVAEPLRAEEIASQEAEPSIAAFRFFHPANLTPHLRSFCTVNGRENVSTTTSLDVRNGVIQRWVETSDLRIGSSWAISNQMIADFQAGGLDSLSRLLLKQDRSPFEQDLLDSVLIYSRNSLFNDVANRLIYIFAAVESLLLRDKNEPIQKNLGERIAFIVGSTSDERVAIRDSVTQLYGLRSAFLHHAEVPAQMESVERFMDHVWRALVVLIGAVGRFRTREDLIEALERRKMA